MVNPHRKALERMWKDRCSVFVQAEITDLDTNLTDFQETPLFEDQPCKLSFENQTTTDEFVYSQSGEAAPFTNHQEITLTLWEGWA